MLSDFQNKILTFKDYNTIDKLIDGLPIDSDEFNSTVFDTNTQKVIKTSNILKLDNSLDLFNIYIQDRYPELVNYFEDVNSINSFNGLSETEEQFALRFESIKETKKTFFKIYDKTKIYKGTKAFFDFIIRFYLKMKYNLSDYFIEINVYEVGAFSYLVTANIAEEEWEYIIKPIVHPNGWGAQFSSINQISDRSYFQGKICNLKKQVDLNSIESSNYEVVEFAKNFISENTTLWEADKYYSVGDWVWYPSVTGNNVGNGNGRIYKCIIAGTSGSTAPIWDGLTSLSTITETDKTVKWECHFLKDKLFSPITVEYNQNACLNDFNKTSPQIFVNGFIENKDTYPFYCEFSINSNDNVIYQTTFEIEFSEKVDPYLVNTYVEVRIDSVLTPVEFKSIERVLPLPSILAEHQKEYRVFTMDLEQGKVYEITVKTEVMGMITKKHIEQEKFIRFFTMDTTDFLPNELAYDL